MTTSAQLSRLFSLAVALTVTGCKGTTSGGTLPDGAPAPGEGEVPADGDYGPFPDPELPSFDRNACPLPDDPLAAITPGVPVDYFAVRRATTLANGTEGATTLAERGEACKTATNKAACTTKLEGLRPGGGWVLEAPFGGSATEYAVYTRGDAVEAVTSVDGLGKLLAPVSVDDALFMLQATPYSLVCESPNVAAVDGGVSLFVTSGIACGEGTKSERHVVFVGADGRLEVKKTWVHEIGKPGCAIGRRPEGLVDVEGPEGTLGHHLAACAHLEAASIVAFERLARELADHGAPASLVERARAAAADEARHATVTAALARRHGGTLAPVVVEERAPRALFALALDNATEGCVRETFGALVATWQSQRAADAELRDAFVTIARDETEHAALAWDIAAWLDTRLSSGERAALARAQAEAVRELAGALERDEPPQDAVAAAGMPSSKDAAHLLGAVAPHLWGHAVPWVATAA